MKRIIVSMICILILYGLIGCKKVEPPLGNSNNTDKNLAGNTNTSDLNSNKDNIAIAQSKSNTDTKDNLTSSNQASTPPLNQNSNDEYTTSGILSPKMAEKIIKPTADAVLLALKNKDMEVLAGYVHPSLGVCFTPYTYVSPNQNIVFSPEKIKGFFTDTTKYTWGNYDNSGDIIELTPTQYYHEYIYSKDFSKADIIAYNKILGGGNTLNNLYDVYHNPIVVEYYFPEFDPKYEGLDWQSLSLVFEEYNSTWYLVGIIHNSMAV